MLQINLLPEKFQSKFRNQRIKKALIEVSIFSIIIILIFAIGIFLMAQILEIMNQNNEKVIQEKEKNLQDFTELEKEISIYKENSQLYDQLLKNQYIWSDILIHITELTPANLQITNLNIQKEKENNQKTITFSGKATSRREIAKFVKKLEDSEKFEEVELSSSGLDEEGKADFQISVKLVK